MGVVFDEVVAEVEAPQPSPPRSADGETGERAGSEDAELRAHRARAALDERRRLRLEAD